MYKPEVGQILHSLNVGNAARNREQTLTPVVVKKVGRKYFECTKYPQTDYPLMTKYRISDWVEHTDYSPTSKLYESEQQYAEEKEAKELARTIGKYFEYGRNYSKLPIQSLRKIMDIVDHDKKVS